MPRKDKKAYNEYMKPYMSSYRKQERELLNLAKQQWGWNRKGLQVKHKKGDKKK